VLRLSSGVGGAAWVLQTHTKKYPAAAAECAILLDAHGADCGLSKQLAAFLALMDVTLLPVHNDYDTRESATIARETVRQSFDPC